jgi:hypothetical protein
MFKRNAPQIGSWSIAALDHLLMKRLAWSQ